MKTLKKYWETILSQSLRQGLVVTWAIAVILASGAAYLIYSYLLADGLAANQKMLAAVEHNEADNRKTQAVLASEGEFRGEFKKVIDLYREAEPLLPQATELANVLDQVQEAGARSHVTVTGLSAVKDSAKSPVAEKLYEREIPAMVIGSYPDVVRFLTDVSRMPRILLVREFSFIGLKSNGVSAGFTLVAYHAPPPGEVPSLPAELTADQSSLIVNPATAPLPTPNGVTQYK